MTSQQASVIERIKSLENQELLKDIEFLLDFEAKYPSSIKFSKEEVKILESRISSFDSGSFISNEEANKRASQWLDSK